MIFLSGVIVTAIGIYEMNDNYMMDKQIKILRYEVEKRELEGKIKEVKR